MRQIHVATEALLPASGRSTVRLTLPSSLAATWLIPRLGAFEREHPAIDLQLIMTTRVIDLKGEQMDLAIRHGKGAWPDVEATFLLEETAMPVCAPGYLDPLPQEPSPEVLRNVRFIVNANIPDEWEEWARAHGVEPPAINDLIALDAMEQALQVAESGHGLAMGRRPVVDGWLERGRLVAPFGGADPTGAAYYLCRPIAAMPTAAGRRLERWLTRKAAEWSGANATVVASSLLEFLSGCPESNSVEISAFPAHLCRQRIHGRRMAWQIKEGCYGPDRLSRFVVDQAASIVHGHQSAAEFHPSPGHQACVP